MHHVFQKILKKSLTDPGGCAIIIHGDFTIPQKGLGVAQLVARYLGVVEAVGSSPVTQTICKQKKTVFGLFLYI